MVIGAGASKQRDEEKASFDMPVGVCRRIRYRAAASTVAADARMSDIVSGMNEIEGI